MVKQMYRWERCDVSCNARCDILGCVGSVYHSLGCVGSVYHSLGCVGSSITLWAVSAQSITVWAVSVQSQFGLCRFSLSQFGLCRFSLSQFGLWRKWYDKQRVKPLEPIEDNRLGLRAGPTQRAGIWVDVSTDWSGHSIKPYSQFESSYFCQTSSLCYACLSFVWAAALLVFVSCIEKPLFVACWGFRHGLWPSSLAFRNPGAPTPPMSRRALPKTPGNTGSVSSARSGSPRSLRSQGSAASSGSSGMSRLQDPFQNHLEVWSSNWPKDRHRGLAQVPDTLVLVLVYVSMCSECSLCCQHG